MCRERKVAALGSGVAERRDGGWRDGVCHAGGPRPPALVRGQGWAGGGLAAVFSACLFSAPGRMSVLLLVCLFQASMMWRFIHFQLRRWREYWNEQSSRKRAAAAAAGTKQQTKLLKRDSGECCEGGPVEASVLWFSIPPAALLLVQGVPSSVLMWWGFPCVCEPVLRGKRVWLVQGTKFLSPENHRMV